MGLYTRLTFHLYDINKSQQNLNILKRIDLINILTETYIYALFNFITIIYLKNVFYNYFCNYACYLITAHMVSENAVVPMRFFWIMFHYITRLNVLRFLLLRYDISPSGTKNKTYIFLILLFTYTYYSHEPQNILWNIKR